MVLLRNIVKHIFTFSLFAGVASSSFSQTITHFQQFPMSINPAYAGSADGGRVAVLAGGEWIRNNYYTKQETNLALAYDNLYRKTGYGLQVTGTKISQFTDNMYLSVKGCIAPKFRFKRKGGTKDYTVSPGLDFTYTTTNNKYTIIRVLFQNGYYYSFYTWRLERPLNYWPNASKQVSLGLTYKSNNLTIAVKGGFYHQSVIQKDAIKYVAYDLKPWLKTTEENNNKNKAVDNTTAVYTDSLVVQTWNQTEIAFYIMQRVNLWKQRGLYANLGSNCYQIRRFNRSFFIPFLSDKETQIVLFAEIDYKKFFAGYQPSVNIISSYGNRYVGFLLFNYERYYMGYRFRKTTIVTSFDSKWYYTNRGYTFKISFEHLL